MIYSKPGTHIKQLNELLNAEHGKIYSLKRIDGEVCLYRELGPMFDLEISGANKTNHRRKKSTVTIYLWIKNRGTSIMTFIKGVPEAKIHEVCEYLDGFRHKVEATYSGDLETAVSDLYKGRGMFTKTELNYDEIPQRG